MLLQHFTVRVFQTPQIHEVQTPFPAVPYSNNVTAFLFPFPACEAAQTNLFSPRGAHTPYSAQQPPFPWTGKRGRISLARRSGRASASPRSHLEVKNSSPNLQLWLYMVHLPISEFSGELREGFAAGGPLPPTSSEGCSDVRQDDAGSIPLCDWQGMFRASHSAVSQNEKTPQVL